VNGQWELSSERPGAFATIADVWHHRWLLGFIGSRALQKTYRRTVLGWLWLFINPLFPLAVRTLIFGGLLGVSSHGIPYFLFLLAGTLAWDALATSLMWGTRSLEMNSNLTDQIYLPRAILPVGNTVPALLDLAIKGAVFLGALAYYAFRDGRTYIRTDVGILWAVGAIALVLAFALAVSFFTSVWGESGRDTRYALGQVLTVWYLLTPVLYPLSAVPAEYQVWMRLNPMATLVETFKWGLFGIGEMQPVELAVTATAIVALLLAGLFYFARADARAVDLR
jgi:lipopolysaccharide transport system permease protein